MVGGVKRKRAETFRQTEMEQKKLDKPSHSHCVEINDISGLVP
jgi:hypothetical protein